MNPQELITEDIKNILVLIDRVQLNGKEALAVAVIQEKLRALLPKEEVKAEVPVEKLEEVIGKDTE